VPQYNLKLHPTAEKELNSLTSDSRERITETLTSVARTEQPAAHSQSKHLNGQRGLFRVRAGQIRAVCILEKPHIWVLKVGKRDTVYRYIDEIEERLPA